MHVGTFDSRNVPFACSQRLLPHSRHRQNRKIKPPYPYVFWLTWPLTRIPLPSPHAKGQGCIEMLRRDGQYIRTQRDGRQPLELLPRTPPRPLCSSTGRIIMEKTHSELLDHLSVVPSPTLTIFPSRNAGTLTLFSSSASSFTPDSSWPGGLAQAAGV